MYERILVPVDGSPTSSKGLEEAIKLAQLTGAKLRLIHAVDELSFAMNADAFGAYAGELIDVVRKAGEATLQNARTQVEAAGIGVDTVLRDSFGSRVYELVADEAARWPADLIVLGTHGRRGVGRALMGSDAEQIARLAPVPVLLVRSAA